MTTETQTCTKCGETKPLTSFYKTRGWYVHECKECAKKRVQAKQAGNPRKTWATQTRASHMRQGYDVRFTIDELYKLAMTRDTCAMCHQPITYRNERLESESTDRRLAMHSATLDRVHNEAYMDMSNVDIICYACNSRKADWTPEKLREYANYLESYLKSR